MKFVPLLFFAVSLCSAGHVEKRASVTDQATLGYATLNGGTTGGGKAIPVIVSALSELKTAVEGDIPKVVLIEGIITGSEIVNVGGNTSVIGKKGAALEGVGFRVNATENVIIRNIKISKVLAETGDAIRTISSSRIWIDHMDLSSDVEHDKNYYGGLIYVARGTAGISISYCYFHDHWKAVLGGLSDAQTEEAKVTWAYNKWENLVSGLPTVRHGLYHLYSNYYLDNLGFIDVNNGSDIYIQDNYFASANGPPINSVFGTIRASGNIGYKPPLGTAITPANYGYIWSPSDASRVPEIVNASAGAILEF